MGSDVSWNWFCTDRCKKIGAPVRDQIGWLEITGMSLNYWSDNFILWIIFVYAHSILASTVLLAFKCLLQIDHAESSALMKRPINLTPFIPAWLLKPSGINVSLPLLENKLEVVPTVSNQNSTYFCLNMMAILVFSLMDLKLENL